MIGIIRPGDSAGKSVGVQAIDSHIRTFAGHRSAGTEEIAQSRTEHQGVFRRGHQQPDSTSWQQAKLSPQRLVRQQCHRDSVTLGRISQKTSYSHMKSHRSRCFECLLQGAGTSVPVTHRCQQSPRSPDHPHGHHPHSLSDDSLSDRLSSPHQSSRRVDRRGDPADHLGHRDSKIRIDPLTKIW